MDKSLNMMNIMPQKPVATNAKTSQAKNSKSDQPAQGFSDVMTEISNDYQEPGDNPAMAAAAADNSNPANLLPAIAVPVMIIPIQLSADLRLNSNGADSEAGNTSIAVNLMPAARKSVLTRAHNVNIRAEQPGGPQLVVHSAGDLTALLPIQPPVDAAEMSKSESSVPKDNHFDSAVLSNLIIGNSNRDSTLAADIQTMPAADIQTMRAPDVQVMPNAIIQAVSEITPGDILDEPVATRQPDLFSDQPVVSAAKSIGSKAASADMKSQLAASSLPQTNQQRTESANNEIIPTANAAEQGSIKTTNDKNTSADSNKDSVLLGNASKGVVREAGAMSKDTGYEQNHVVGMVEHQFIPINNQVVQEAKQLTEPPIHDPYNISSQIVEQAHLVNGSENSQMIIKLKPEHLGELTLKVAVENGVVSASFHSDNQEVRGIIESSLAQLKQEMFSQGLKVDHVGVYAGLGQFLSNGQQRETARQPLARFSNKKADQQAFQDIEAITEMPEAMDGVDYRV